MKYLMLCLVLLSRPAFAGTEPDSEISTFGLQFDHSTIMVDDLDKAGDFYRDVLQLEELETPWGKSPQIRFFSMGGNTQLHVAKIDDDTAEQPKVIHIAFTVQDFDAYLAFLEEMNIAYANFPGNSTEPQVRPDGVRQVYFQDPAGNWLEINDARY